MLRKTLNSEIMKNSSGRVRVAKKKFGSNRVAGTRQTLVRGGHCLNVDDDDDDGSLESESGLSITLGNGTFGDQIENLRTLFKCSPQICILGVFPQLWGEWSWKSILTTHSKVVFSILDLKKSPFS